MVVHKVAHQLDRPVAQRDVLLQARPAQVQVAIFEACELVGLKVVSDLEGQRFGRVLDDQLADDDFDLAGCQAGVLHAGRPAAHGAAHGQDEFAAHPFGGLVASGVSGVMTTWVTP